MDRESSLHEDAAELSGRISQETVAACLGSLGGHVRAVVLTGSLARNEGSFLRVFNGWRLLGDAEFLVVLDKFHGIDRQREVERLKSDIENALAKDGLTCTISLAIADDRFFRGLKPHIFAYELSRHGKVVFGEAAVLALIPQFAGSDIPLEDAWRMLGNRLVEQLEVLAGCDLLEGSLPDALFYRTVKLYLDMATSWLLFQGKYEPSYRGRCEILQSQSFEDGTAPFDLRAFATEVAKCTAWKLSPTEKGKPEATSIFWYSSHHYASRLWQWEVAQLGKHGRPEGSGPRGPRQGVSARLRGWAYVVRESGVRGIRRWPAWMAQWRRSPRFRVYFAAAELYGVLPPILRGEADRAETARRTESINRTLPMPASDLNGEWKLLARTIAWNYHAFLENTRA